ncbi:E3 ubiquitin-protein ligase RKP [Vitis vinifera]|uniref:E3 ubiquitin-protein ligase RKP n=1 Tax=Vitis vinifera TaxID=29760 RepID=A0A438KJY2_VITVI|nr:E3 ubiquitin-protein ligase RKP [Vitis vinifera]
MLRSKNGTFNAVHQVLRSSFSPCTPLYSNILVYTLNLPLIINWSFCLWLTASMFCARVILHLSLRQYSSSKDLLHSYDSSLKHFFFFFFPHWFDKIASGGDRKWYLQSSGGPYAPLEHALALALFLNLTMYCCWILGQNSNFIASWEAVTEMFYVLFGVIISTILLDWRDLVRVIRASSEPASSGLILRLKFLALKEGLVVVPFLGVNNLCVEGGLGSCSFMGVQCNCLNLPYQKQSQSEYPNLPLKWVFFKTLICCVVTFVVTHFNDPRISSADLRDLLLQSISVLVQYKEFLAAFESNIVATQRMPKALLSAFDNRSWIPVTNILLRLCKGSGFGSSKHGESSSSSFVFQKLLREACIVDDELFSAFLNRLFNYLSWTMTEFSVSVREMQEKHRVGLLLNDDSRMEHACGSLQT